MFTGAAVGCGWLRIGGRSGYDVDRILDMFIARPLIGWLFRAARHGSIARELAAPHENYWREHQEIHSPFMHANADTFF